MEENKKDLFYQLEEASSTYSIIFKDDDSFYQLKKASSTCSIILKKGDKVITEMLVSYSWVYNSNNCNHSLCRYWGGKPGIQMSGTGEGSYYGKNLTW